MRPAIRFAGPDDAPTILRFIQALAEYEREPDAVETTEATLREQMASAAPPFECLLAAVPASADGDAGRVEAVGFALFFQSYSTWRGRSGIYLEDLFVPPEHRGKGYGAALLGRLAALTVGRGGARLEWSVLDWNDSAIGFYERLGAVGQSEWTVYRLAGPALQRLADAQP